MVGQFKDDQYQSHNHNTLMTWNNESGTYPYVPTGKDNANRLIPTSTPTNGRFGTTTHGKQKGVKYIIKVL